MTVRIKICGLTNREDALQAVDCGADALGFVFYPKSPRCVTPEAVAAICADLPPFVTRVGLFVNEAAETMLAVAGECGLDVLQLHGDEMPSACHLPPYRVIKGVRPASAQDLPGYADFPVSALLVDAAVPGQFGGTGQRADWALARQLAATRRVILAGGLTPDNVAEAVRQVRPYAVDVSSGVESAPGKKDPVKVAEFIRRAREAS